MTNTKTLKITGASKIRKRWDALKKRGNVLTFDRAKLLNGVWNRLQKSDRLLMDFATTVLDEPKGKNLGTLVRLAIAFEEISDRETWGQLDSKDVAFLSRIKTKTKRRKIMTKVRAMLKRSNRTAVSFNSFRRIAIDILGEDGYRAHLTERRNGSSLKAELFALKQYLLGLLNKNTVTECDMPTDVRKALGLDLCS